MCESQNVEIVMEEGFVQAFSYNLPKVSVDMVVRFFAASTEVKASKWFVMTVSFYCSRKLLN